MSRNSRVGRPSKLTPEVAAQVIVAIDRGDTVTLIAAEMGVACQTFYRWIKLNPELASHFAARRARADSARTGLRMRSCATCGNEFEWAPHQKHCRPECRPTTCTIEGCDQPLVSRGLCRAHYYRLKRYGDPLANGVRHTGRPVHGHAPRSRRTSTYRTWASMLTRCRNGGHPSYERYGGRGIRVCRRWLRFENFLADMGPRPEGKTIDRIDNDGHYEPGNCRWATPREQRANQRTPMT